MPQQIPDEVLYDIRLIERHLNKGVLNPKDLEKHLNALEDLTEQSEVTTFDELDAQVSGKESVKAASTVMDRSVN